MAESQPLSRRPECQHFSCWNHTYCVWDSLSQDIPNVVRDAYLQLGFNELADGSRLAHPAGDCNVRYGQVYGPRGNRLCDARGQV